MPTRAPASVRDQLRLPPTAHLLVGVGPLDANKGFHSAIWSLDILRYLHPHIHLALVGEGPDRLRLEQFTQVTGLTNRVHFLGQQLDGAAWLAAADVVWVPSEGGGGVNVALEAMALGRAVVASNVPPLAEVIVDGECGMLFPPKDRPALARQTWRLLEDPRPCPADGGGGPTAGGAPFLGCSIAQPFLRVPGQAA